MRKLPNETGAEKLGHTPHRKCILAGDSRPAEELVRLALGPDDRVAPDILGKAQGRGAWLGCDRATLEKAMADGKLKAGLARAFKSGAIAFPNDLAGRIENALERATMDRLGLEARASNLLTGSEKIETAARQGQLAMLLHARDAAADGCGKLDQAWRVGSDDRNVKALHLPVDRESLSVALGRQNVVHVGVTDPRAANRVGHHLFRWSRFTGHDLHDRFGGELGKKVA